MRLVTQGNLKEQRWAHPPTKPLAIVARDHTTAARLAREERLAIKRTQGWKSPMYVEGGTRREFTEMFIRLHQAHDRGFVLIVREWTLLDESMRRLALELARTQSFEGRPCPCLVHLYTSTSELCDGRTDPDAQIMAPVKLLEAGFAVWRLIEDDKPAQHGAMVQA